MKIKDETKVLLVILVLSLVAGVLLCSGCKSVWLDSGEGESTTALDMVRREPAESGSGGYDVDRDASDGDLDNSRIVLRLDDNQKWQEPGRGIGNDDNNRADRNSVFIDVAGVPAVNIVICPDWCSDWAADTAIFAGWDKSDTRDKEVVEESGQQTAASRQRADGHRQGTDRHGLTLADCWVLFAVCCLLFAGWWVWKNRATVHEALDVDDDGDIDMDDIKAARDKVLRKGGADEVT